MRNQYFKKHISLLFIVAILFLGMCQEQLPADSLFMSQDTHPLQASISTVKPLTDAFIVCTEDLFGRQPALTLLQKSRRVHETLRSNTGFLLTSVIPLSDLSGLLRRTVSQVFTCKFLCITIIMYYIHHQDGQKS